MMSQTVDPRAGGAQRAAAYAARTSTYGHSTEAPRADRARLRGWMLAGAVAAMAAVSVLTPAHQTSAQETAQGAGDEATVSALLPRGFSSAYLSAREADRAGDVASAAYYYRRAFRSDPTALFVAARALRYSFIVGEVDPALPIAARLVSNGVRAEYAPLALAVEAVRSGDWNAAARYLEEDAGGNALSELVLGWIAYGAGDRDAAFDYFLGNTDAPIKLAFGNLNAGYLAAAIGEPARAAGYFETAATTLGVWPRELAFAAAAAYQAAGDLERAAEILAEAREQAPLDLSLSAAQERLEAGVPVMQPIGSAASGVARVLVGIAGVTGEEPRDALEASAVLTQFARRLAPDYDQAHLLAGQRLYALGHNAQSAEAFASVAADSPLSFDARFGGAVALGEMDETADAIEALSALVAEGFDGPRVQFALGSFAQSERAYETCAIAYEAGLDSLRTAFGDLRSGDWPYLFYAGVCRERNDEWDAAEAHFVAALELNPAQADVLNYFGYSLVEQRRRFDEAREMIEQAVALSPESGHIVDSLGWLMWRTGDFEGAVRELARALQLEPNIYEINDHYGDALWMVGRKREARYQWERALLFEPEDPETIARIERKLEIGLDAVLAEEGETPPQALGGEDAGAKPRRGDAERNGG